MTYTSPYLHTHDRSAMRSMSRCVGVHAVCRMESIGYVIELIQGLKVLADNTIVPHAYYLDEVITNDTQIPNLTMRNSKNAVKIITRHPTYEAAYMEMQKRFDHRVKAHFSDK